MSEIKFAAISFVSLLTVVNPLGALPIYLALTSTQPGESSSGKNVALRASLVALGALILFALVGQFIFELFSVSIAGLRLVGGILFFIVGYDMLRGEVARVKGNLENSDPGEDAAITPIGVPLIAGPGAISTVMILMSQTDSLLSKSALLAVIVGVMTLTFFLLAYARRIMRVLGENGAKLLARIMGLIVMMVAVEFFFAGLKPFVTQLWPGG